jgi:hypothetical protein
MTVGLISIGGTTTRHRKGENQTSDGHHASEQNNPMLNLLLLPSMLQTLNQAKDTREVNRLGSMKLKKVNQQRNCQQKQSPKHIWLLKMH